MARKLLTLEDLYAFYSQRNKTIHFSAKDDGDEIVVSLPAQITFEDGSDGATEGLTPVHLKACHTGANVNHCYCDDETTIAALPSFSNRPILAYIFKDDDGNYQFRDHAKHINEDGEVVYDEHPVGVVREACNAHLEWDAEAEKNYVHVDGYIFDEYSKAKEILERDGECSVSVEIAIRDFSYNAKEKLLVFNDFYFEGVTILGVREDGSVVNPGMVGSNIRIADFKRKNNAMFSEEKMMQLLEKIESKLNELTDNSKGKEEPNLEDQNKIVEPETAIEPETATPVEPETSVPAEPDNQPENTEPEAAPVEPTTEPEGEPEGVVEPEGNEPETAEPVAEPVEPAAEPAEPTEPATFSKTFELSHDDIRCGLYGLLEAVESTNNEYYYIEKVFDDYFIYSGMSGLYKQGYSKTETDVAFVGERAHMNAEYLTDEELAIINEMRTNYPTLVEKLAQYEEEPKKLKLLNSPDYALIQENAEYKKLCERDTYFNLSFDEVKAQCEALLNAEAKKIGSNYAANETAQAKYTAKPVAMTSKPTAHGRYGGMFVK